ncbi:hypothetical protein [Flexibacterium corallicola]|uniref:hypothetical protein n=1 Tax=Flexibacterium corallicola TaxID=3037259 RepID=UPI00286EC028|nr:hypothetical protein [Pseudovibrio sp. M1P-2-3]
MSLRKQSRHRRKRSSKHFEHAARKKQGDSFEAVVERLCRGLQLQVERRRLARLKQEGNSPSQGGAT